MTELVLHIGLPKTATTFLQRQILRRHPNVALFHKKNTPKLIRKAQLFLREGADDFAELGGSLRTDRVNVLTNENLSLTATSFWSNRGICTPVTLARNIERLSSQVLGRPGAVRAIISVRRQDHWVASRYAQSASRFAAPGQEDFERRVRNAITTHFETRGVWIDYAHVIETLEKACPNGVLVLMQEELEHAPLEWAQKLDEFLGTQECVELVRGEIERGIKKYSLSAGCNVWRLKTASDAFVTVTHEIEGFVLHRYAASNALLRDRGLDFSRYY